MKKDSELDSTEFETTYAQIISELGLTEEQIATVYGWYREDPMQFNDSFFEQILT